MNIFINFKVQIDKNMVKKSLTELLVKNSSVKNRTHLKHRLINEGYLKNECLHCGIGPIWKGSKMTLEMDHINGDNTDNRLENLRILCLHCHSQTPTFRRPKSKRKSKIGNVKSISIISIVTIILICVIYYLYERIYPREPEYVFIKYIY